MENKNKNKWLTVIGVIWKNKKNTLYKCYWNDGTVDIMTLAELYFNYKNTSELNNLLRIEERDSE